MLVGCSQYPSKLAEAGFFFEPVSDGKDRCVCFACGLSLVNWNATDNPFTEHLRYAESTESDHRSCKFVELIRRYNPSLFELEKEAKFSLSDEVLPEIDEDSIDPATALAVKAEYNHRRDFLKTLLVSTMFDPSLNCPSFDSNLA
jgi:hypothetical protein